MDAFRAARDAAEVLAMRGHGRHRAHRPRSAFLSPTVALTAALAAACVVVMPVSATAGSAHVTPAASRIVTASSGHVEVPASPEADAGSPASITPAITDAVATAASPSPGDGTASTTARSAPAAIRLAKRLRPFADRVVTSTPSELDLPRVPWWGGPAYYAKFSKATAAGWTSDSFFPIAVFYGKPEHAPVLAGLGVNTYMGAEHDGSPISRITGTGISVIAQDEWTASELGNDPRVVGWHISDECDQGEGECWLDGDEYARVLKQQGYARAARARNDGRFVQANFGNGALGTWWATHTMAQHVATADVTSVDKYAYTSPGVRYVITHSPYWPAGRDPQSSGAYGWLQDRMATYSGSTKPNWVFIETSEPFLNEDGATSIAPGQITGAAWNAIIHGAAGISYFQHNNNGCGTYSLVQCSSALQSTVRRLDADIAGLAPVINTQSYAWSFGSGLDTSLKVKDGTAYILSMTTGGTGQRSFTLPAGVRGTSVTVLGENRTIPVVNGRFTDAFATEWTHHNYAVTLAG